MPEETNIQELKRQPNPQPPDIISTPPPSILLYLILLSTSIVLIVIAFQIDKKPDWAGLLINLASGFIGAIIILIVVYRRLRASEVNAIQDYALATSIFFTSIFSKDIRTKISYSKILFKQFKKIKPMRYLERPALENLFSKHPKGFILIGGPGTGKSTLVQFITIKQLEAVIRKPRKCQVPFFIPASHWQNENLSEYILNEACSYSFIKRELFYEWLEKGEALIIIDAVDENIKPTIALSQIIKFKEHFPKSPLIITLRPTSSLQIEALNLPMEKMPSLTTEEAHRLISMLQK